ncbi:hypothetical protein FDP41_003735 [Naegleria fowleri]|uniref:Uncharacterized protein n=1 Tax=Naegleria fowleri TaxID=5763 RepID=A0A6A5BQV1_NAEFO|nr:uncharacterized protein FDP41_003735 [Naegleria fowleri]KAF0977082.1 hypothetical protein FDP41_003735 [Naegleria fowleri]CAG4708722.1 unnamed protein product [Naegleria fowleri]
MLSQQKDTTQKTKTKWQELLEAPKGCMEYNPHQAFALQVFWIVRSFRAATEMIEKGFLPCSQATLRDTPTTLCYLFRISQQDGHEQMAEEFKKQVKTIGQHPHYQPAFKSIKMGIAQQNIEMKLKQGGINIEPLKWNPDEPMEGHEDELDFHPIVLECTEVYLDNRSFYDHSASQDWMNHYPEIVKPCRSLKPKTFCVGHPSEEIWEKALESALKAIRFNGDETRQVKIIQPGLFLHDSFSSNNENAQQQVATMFLEMDLTIANDRLEHCQSYFSQIQQDLHAPFMVVLPTNLHDGEEVVVQEKVQVRIMLSFSYSKETSSKNLSALIQDCESFKGRIIVFCENGSENDQATQFAQEFMELSGLSSSNFLTILDGKLAEKNNTLAGFILHPLYNKLIINEQLNYKP